MRYVASMLLATIAILSVPDSASALDRVYMKDGTVVEGDILKTRFMQVFITTADGNRTIPMPDVDRIERNVRPGSAARKVDRTAHDGQWKVRMTPGKRNRLRNTTKPYDDVITIKNGMLTTKVGGRYRFAPARCRFTPKGAAVVVVAEVGNLTHGTSLYTLTIAGAKLSGTLDWGKLGEDGKAKSAQFTIAGTREKPEPAGGAKKTGGETPARPATATPPRPAPKKLTPAERAKRDAAMSALRAAIAAKVGAGSRPRSSFKLGATSLRGTVTSADAKGISVRSPMGTMSLAWSGISVAETVKLARACSVDAKLVRAVEALR